MERSGQDSEKVLDGIIIGIEWAGIVGVVPWSFTLQELHIMMIAKQRADWERSALLTATVRNIFVSKKSDMTLPDDINPYSKKKKSVKQKPVKMAKDFIVDVFDKRYSKKRKTKT